MYSLVPLVIGSHRSSEKYFCNLRIDTIIEQYSAFPSHDGLVLHDFIIIDCLTEPTFRWETTAKVINCQLLLIIKL